MKNKVKIKLLILLLVFSFFIRVYKLDYPANYVFDEVYHAFSAKEYLKGSKEVWEWWTTPPPHVAFEWTHPPLAKEIMTANMFLVNSTQAWAWRLPGVIFGTINIFLVFKLAQILFKNDRIALLSAFLLSLDSLTFVQSRTGMNDIYVITFILSSLILFIQKKLLLSAIFFGLALSSKWTALYLSPVYLLLLVKDHQMKKLIYFIAIPPIIYLTTYLPFFILGHSFDQFIELQKQMWWYHTHLKAAHDYSSPWWSWPLNLYPVWYFVEYQNEKMANIFATGNPFLFWAGISAIVITVVELIFKRSFALMITLLGFFVFWLPWAFSPRIMFLYHFSPSVPFLTIALGYQLNAIINSKQNAVLAVFILALIILGFILMYPFTTGVFLPRDLVGLFFYTNLTKNPF